MEKLQEAIMVNDSEARDAVRQLMKRFELIAKQGAGLAYVLAKRDRREYERLLKAAEVAQKTVIQPLVDADKENDQVYAALDDTDADWPKSVFAMLNQGGVELTVEKALERIKFVQSLEQQFDEEMRRQNGSAEPGKEE